MITKIKTIAHLGQNTRTKRKLKITLTNGVKITAEACHESWEQWGGRDEDLFVTVPIVERHNDWLHGGECECGI